LIALYIWPLTQRNATQAQAQAQAQAKKLASGKAESTVSPGFSDEINFGKISILMSHDDAPVFG
jgi:hypothetical protein